MASSDNVVAGAQVCLVSQIPSPTNMSAEAEIPARSYNKPALITFQKSMPVCVHSRTHTCTCMCDDACICGRGREADSEKEVPPGILAAAVVKIR